jgi:phosphoglycerate dehydrogenase-like enzyme
MNRMNVLVDGSLESRHVEKIRAVSEDIEVLRLNSPGEVLETMPDVDIVFGDVTPAMFERGTRLRWSQLLSAGADTQLFPEYVESDVVLTSAKGLVGTHLADHAMALLLGLTRGISHAVRNPDWDQRMSIRKISWELNGKTMGIVGFGGTGRELAVRAQGFGMKVIAVDPERVEVSDFIEEVWTTDRFHELLAESDVVAICAPSTRETRGMFDRAAFREMRNHAMLINVTRGDIMDEEALLEALEQGQIGGAGLDVTPREPLLDDHPLWHMDNVIITPHTAGGSPERLDRSVNLFCQNLERFLNKEPLLNVIDKQKGY